MKQYLPSDDVASPPQIYLGQDFPHYKPMTDKECENYLKNGAIRAYKTMLDRRTSYEKVEFKFDAEKWSDYE